MKPDRFKYVATEEQSEVAKVAYGLLGLRVLTGRLYDWEKKQVIRLIERAMV